MRLWLPKYGYHGDIGFSVRSGPPSRIAAKNLTDCTWVSINMAAKFFSMWVWSMISNLGIHRAHSYFICNFSYRILCTLSTKTPTIAVISRTFIQWLTIRAWWIFLILPGAVTSTGHPGCDSSWADFWPGLNSLVQKWIVFSRGAKSN